MTTDPQQTPQDASQSPTTAKQVAAASWWLQLFGIFASLAMSSLALFTTIAIAIGGCAMTQINKKVGEIHDSQVSLARLSELPTTVAEFQKETRQALNETDNRLDTLSEKVAKLEGLPSQMREALTEFNNAKAGFATSSADARVAAVSLNAATNEIGALKSTVARIQTQVEQLAQLPDSVEKTRAMVAQLSKAGSVSPRLSAVIHVTLRKGSPLPPEGDFDRMRMEFAISEIPILADSEKLPALTIDSAEIRRATTDDPAATLVATTPKTPPTVQPILDRTAAKLYLIVWYKKSDKEPDFADGSYYARLSVSWPDRP